MRNINQITQYSSICCSRDGLLQTQMHCIFILCAGFAESPFASGVPEYRYLRCNEDASRYCLQGRADHAARCWWAGRIQMGSVHFKKTLVLGVYSHEPPSDVSNSAAENS